MMNREQVSSERSERLGRVIAGVLAAGERGETVDPERIVAEHPEMAEELRSFFTNDERMRSLVGRIGNPSVDEREGERGRRGEGEKGDSEDVTLPPRKERAEGGACRYQAVLAVK